MLNKGKRLTSEPIKKTNRCSSFTKDEDKDMSYLPHGLSRRFTLLPTLQQIEIGGVKINKRITGKKYEFGSYDRDLKHYYQQKRMIQIIAIIALCLALALVAWCLIAC